MHFKAEAIVWVEPNLGYASVNYSDEDVVLVTFLDSNKSLSVDIDNVFMVHGEFYHNFMESLTSGIMDAAGDYKIAEDIDEIMDNMYKLVIAYRRVIKNGR